jgi:hypothetical protein
MFETSIGVYPRNIDCSILRYAMPDRIKREALAKAIDRSDNAGMGGKKDRLPSVVRS